MPPSRSQSKSPGTTSPPATEPETPTPAAESPSSDQGSSKRSRAPAGSGFFKDTGPGFDKDAKADPPPAPAPVAGQEGWEEDSVRSLLSAKGTILHAALGVGKEDWAYTERDLNAIAPPLTRILNRYPVTAAAGAAGDELAVVVGLGGYVTRSYVERRQVLAMRAPEEPQPITGRAPEPGDVSPLQAQPSPEPEPETEETGLRPAGPDARRYAE